MDYIQRRRAAEGMSGGIYQRMAPAISTNRGASSGPGTNYLQELMALLTSGRSQAQASEVDPRAQLIEQMMQPRGAEGYAQPIPDPTQGPTPQDFIENILKRNE